MTLSEVLAHGTQLLQQALASPSQRLALAAALVAAALILVSAFVKTIIPLRWLAVGSNLGFVVYGLAQPSPLVLALHALLLPVNLWRVIEMQRLTRRVGLAANDPGRLAVLLQPHMRRRRMKAGEVLFGRGDPADRLYLLAAGRMELVETQRALLPGRMFGEIAFFAPDRRRSATARCVTDCTVLSIDEDTFRQMYFQHPEFGFEVVRMIAARLTEDVQRLEQQLAQRDVTATDG